jgi:ABC-type branched-subunit amino acid transport system permease subunit
VKEKRRTRFTILLAVVIVALIIGDRDTALGMAVGAAIIWSITEYIERQRDKNN